MYLKLSNISYYSSTKIVYFLKFQYFIPEQRGSVQRRQGMIYNARSSKRKTITGYNFIIRTGPKARLAIRRHSQAVRQRTANPLSPVRIWVAPPVILKGFPTGSPFFIGVFLNSPIPTEGYREMSRYVERSPKSPTIRHKSWHTY